MAEYIDKAALVSEIEKNKLMAREPAARRILELIRNMTVFVGVGLNENVAPMKHGRFIEDETSCPGAGLANYKCTACGRINGSWRQGLPAERLPSYCWNCGAKMDGGAEG